MQRPLLTGIKALIIVGCTMFTVTESTAAPSVKTEDYGTSADGELVRAYTLMNDRGTTVRLLSLGALIDQINIADQHGKRANVVLGLPDLAAYESNGSFNRTVGRFANRIAGGGFTLDGQRHDLAVNSRGIAMHGGPRGFGRRNWQAAPRVAGNTAAVSFTLASAHGDSGFPGNLQVDVTYTLDDADALRIDYRATTDRPTVVNFTNHTYFNLAGDGSRDVHDHLLQVLADEYTPADAAQVPTGEIDSVTGTPFDLRQPVKIGDRIADAHPQMRIARGFDHNFVLSRQARREPALAIRLHDPHSGRRMNVLTTEPGVQVYTANGFDGSRLGAGGRLLRQGYGIALETQHFPDSPNKPQFPSTVLRPGQEFRSTTVFEFPTATGNLR